MKHYIQVDQNLLSKKQTAEYFGVTKATLREWRKANILKPFCRLEGKSHYRLEELISLSIFIFENDGLVGDFKSANEYWPN